MSYWKQITFNGLKQLQGSSGVYVVYHHTKPVAIGHHLDLMGRMAAYLGTLKKVSRLDTGSRYIPSGYLSNAHTEYHNNFSADPDDCHIKYKLDADEKSAKRLIKRLDPEWTRRERKRPVSRKQARKTGKRAVTPRDVPTDTLVLILEMATAGRTNVAISERLNDLKLRSWTGNKWSPSSVFRFLASESVPSEYDTVEEVTTSQGKLLYCQGSRRRYTGRNMQERFNSRVSYTPPVDESVKSLRTVLANS